MPYLVLHSRDACWHPSQAGLLRAALQDDGLLDADCQADASAACLAGEQFLQFIMFLGCSPQLALTADAASGGTPLCTIRFIECDAVRLIAAERRLPARCPHCRAEAVIDTPMADQMYACAGCGKSIPVPALDWRQAAGFGRFFIEVSGIYPHEAVPTERLLERLRDFSHGDWKYFFTGKPL